MQHGPRTGTGSAFVVGKRNLFPFEQVSLIFLHTWPTCYSVTDERLTVAAIVLNAEELDRKSI